MGQERFKLPAKSHKKIRIFSKNFSGKTTTLQKFQNFHKKNQKNLKKNTRIFKKLLTLSSSKVRFSQIDNVYDVLPQFTKNIVKVFAPPAPPEPPKLGGKGPGGGTVFRVEYGWAMEISEPIGRTSWNNAQQMCSNYNGGGFRDWYLPSKDELNMSYNALRRFGIQFGNEWHWTSTTGAWGKAWGTNFSVGYDEYPSAIGVVRAVRGFSY